MRLELFDVRRRWPRQRTQRDDERGFVNSGILFFTVFCSIRRPYITFKLPRGDMDTPPRLRNFFRYLAIGMSHFRYLRNGLCDRHRAEITIMQFIGHSLRVLHFFLRHSENFYLVSYCEPSCILHSSPSYFSKCSLVNILSESLSSLPTPHKRSNCTT